MNCIQVANNNFNWANNLVESEGASYLDNPSIAGCLYVGLLSAGGLVVFTAKTSIDLVKRSVTQLSYQDVLASIVSIVATVIALAIFPLIFTGSSAFLLYNLVDCTKAKPSEEEKVNTSAKVIYL